MNQIVRKARARWFARKCPAKAGRAELRKQLPGGNAQRQVARPSFRHRSSPSYSYREQDASMLQAETGVTSAPRPKCRADMVLVVVTPHPIAPGMDRHTYLCKPCNQTKTYMLPNGSPLAAGDRPRDIPW